MKQNIEQAAKAELRQKFFKECVGFRELDYPVGYRPIKVNMAPHDLFEWFWREFATQQTEALPETGKEVSKGDLYFEANVRNPYPEDSQSRTAYKKGFYECFEWLEPLHPTPTEGSESKLKEEKSKYKIEYSSTGKELEVEVYGTDMKDALSFFHKHYHQVDKVYAVHSLAPTPTEQGREAVEVNQGKQVD